MKGGHKNGREKERGEKGHNKIERNRTPRKKRKEQES